MALLFQSLSLSVEDPVSLPSSYSRGTVSIFALMFVEGSAYPSSCSLHRARLTGMDQQR